MTPIKDLRSRRSTSHNKFDHLYASHQRDALADLQTQLKGHQQLYEKQRDIINLL
jgi:hypothetical protein